MTNREKGASLAAPATPHAGRAVTSLVRARNVRTPYAYILRKADTTKGCSVLDATLAITWKGNHISRMPCSRLRGKQMRITDRYMSELGWYQAGTPQESPKVFVPRWVSVLKSFAEENAERIAETFAECRKNYTDTTGALL